MKLEGQLIAQNINIAIITARFNEFITQKLTEGAKDCLIRHGVSEKNITEAWVPGAFEIPLVSNKLDKSKKSDPVIFLGSISKAATAHFDHVAAATTSGIAEVNMSTGVPTIFGVLTTETIEQAIERAGTKSGNKGYEAALCAIEMANLIKKIEE